MAEVLPIKLADLGSGQGELREFESGDKIPLAALAGVQPLLAPRVYYVLTGSRALGTTYTNGSPVEIEVLISATGNLYALLEIKVEGAAVFYSVQAPAAGFRTTVSFPVPASKTYSVDWIAGTSGALVTWSELRPA